MIASGVSSASIIPTPIATLSGSALSVMDEVAVGDLVDEPARRLVRGVLVRILEQDPELVAADPRDHVAVPNSAGEQVRDLDQRLVAGAMAEACR